MKIKIGFISNSSNSSFIIPKKILSEVQIAQIKDHINYAKAHLPKIAWAEEINRWDIEETDEQIRAYTGMDNFDMEEFLVAIGVEIEGIIYDY